jgi:thymidylate synthase (FAD)
MNTRLISYSQSIDSMSIEESIAYCARVSNPKNQDNHSTSKGLLRYLIREGHFSPFEMVSVCLEIVTTRDIARQILRHRSFSFQEFSQRYANPTEDLNFSIREARLQDNKNRQNSIEVNDTDLEYTWCTKQLMLKEEAVNAYKWAISKGIAKEQARAVLPEGMMESRLYMNGTVRSWMHYIELRTGNGTQKEHITVAKHAAVTISQIFPMIMEFVQGEK